VEYTRRQDAQGNEATFLSMLALLGDSVPGTDWAETMANRAQVYEEEDCVEAERLLAETSQDAPAHLPAIQTNAAEVAVARHDAPARLPAIRATDEDTCTTCPNCEAAAIACYGVIYG
jgi:hypothetical protein